MVCMTGTIYSGSIFYDTVSLRLGNLISSDDYKLSFLEVIFARFLTSLIGPLFFRALLELINSPRSFSTLILMGMDLDRSRIRVLLALEHWSSLESSSTEHKGFSLIFFLSRAFIFKCWGYTSSLTPTVAALEGVVGCCELFLGG